MFKTKTKTFIFVLEAPRDQDPGIEDYITAFGTMGLSMRYRLTTPRVRHSHGPGIGVRVRVRGTVGMADPGNGGPREWRTGIIDATGSPVFITDPSSLLSYLFVCLQAPITPESDPSATSDSKISEPAGQTGL